jgi:hypothetical protein
MKIKSGSPGNKLRDLINFKNPKNWGGGYPDRWTGTDKYTDRQQGNLINFILFFQNKEISSMK